MSPTEDLNRDRRNDPRTTDDLIQLALTEEDEDAAWEPVVVLHFRGTAEVLERAQLLCGSEDPGSRCLGARILAQLGVPERSFPEKSFQILATMLSKESDPEVLQSIAHAFGHLNDARAIPLLAPLLEHPNEDVRYGVVHGMSRHEDQAAITALIQLSRDDDSDVRDWATFGLGQMIRLDTPEIRDALFARCKDPDDDTRGEALVGLASRKDPRVLGPLMDELSSETVGLLAVEAAEELGDSRLAPVLLALKEAWAGDDDRHTNRLNHALLACLPPGNA
jgi:HEAT repeat protein